MDGPMHCVHLEADASARLNSGSRSFNCRPFQSNVGPTKEADCSVRVRVSDTRRGT